MAQPYSQIPLKITQLQEDPAPSETGWMVYVRDGQTYKVQVNALLNVSGVPTSRVVAAGTGLTGGGALSSNITISVAVGGIGSTQLDLTGVSAGVYGNSNNYPVITVDANGRLTAATTLPLPSTSGFVPTSRQVIAGIGLTGGGTLTSDVTLSAALSNATPLAVGDATAGVSNTMARADHVHPSIDLTDTDQTNGVLSPTRGGTGTALTAPADGGIAYSDGSNILISSAGSLNQVLASSGTGAPYWANVDLSIPVGANLVKAGPASGVDAIPTYRNLVNADLQYDSLTINGTPVTLGSSGTITAAAPYALTIGSGLSGTSYNGSSAVTITNTAPDQTVVLTGAGTVAVTGTYPNFTLTGTGGTVTSITAGTGLTGGTITTSGTIAIDTVAATNGGTGTSTVATGDLLYGSATDTWSKLPLGVAYKSLIINASGTQVEWNAVPLNQTTAVSGELGVANGGTGVSTITGLVKGNGTTAFTAATSGTDYAPATSGTSILYGNGAGGFSNVTVGSGLSFSAGTLSSTSAGGSVTSVAALTLGTTGTDLSSTVANSTTTPVITLNVPTASAANRGALSSADWSTFNGKQAAYTNLTTIGSLANATGWLYNNGSGTFSYSTPTKTDVGLSNVTNDIQTKEAIVPNTAPASGQILVGNAGGTAYAPVAMSSDATLASTGSLTLATVNANVGAFTNANITVDAKGRITAAANGAASGGTVTDVSVVSANGFAGTVATSTTTPAITLSTTITGLLKGNGTAISAATSGTDYAPATSGTSILYGNGAGGFSNVTVGANLTFTAGTLAATASSPQIDNVFLENNQTITASYTVSTNKSSMTVGPITVPSGMNITVPNGSRLVIL